ncbi:hypothetical protein H634G_00867 [Metarhizium anisopliae BRIP 53293]|uniref:Myb-like domain-containing protein n=1 Tax=Metarhizium anisopliae BRIP 53293 TaxID=1291518 RepID=A0A0D9PBL0_METAN|nr:hypothetical protein H634G_00867 [Metarhizium anisopliae BRIP 53293]KJK92531.1 hypothetical protein H633G_03573 [Metarhizium anisopliae BRIP 53284]
MLLPSALSCDSAQPSRPALQSSFFSPPASPPTITSATALGNIMTTCRSLQSLIATPASPSSLSIVPPPSLAQLPTPPLAHAALPMKLRLRARPTPSSSSTNSEDLYAPRRIVKRSAHPRGINKRRRAGGDDMGRGDVPSEEEDMDSDVESGSDSQQLQPRSDNRPEEPAAPTTPKRARIAPERLPLGLERSDFHNIHRLEGGCSSDGKGTEVEVEADGEEWSAEDDRILVELVLEKLKLAKSEWHDCARNLGKDRHSVNRRWKSLIMRGDVGLKTRSSNRRRLHSTWR